MMRVKFWGTRGSIATPGRTTMRYGGNTSCVEVRTDNQIIIFDAGTGIRNLGLSLIKEFNTRPITLHIFISHTHWDHIQGFPFFLPAYEGHNRIHIYGPPGRDKSFDELLRIQMDSDYFPVDLGDMSPNIEVHEVRQAIRLGNLSIESFYLNHPALTLGYRINHGNQTLVYATDNEPYEGSIHASGHPRAKDTDLPSYLDEKFVEFLKDADLYIGEAQYTHEEYEEKKGWGHSPLESTVRFAVEANVRRLGLFHHDPIHDDRFIDRMIAHAQKLVRSYGGKTRCFGAKEGMKIDLR